MKQVRRLLRMLAVAAVSAHALLAPAQANDSQMKPPRRRSDYSLFHSPPERVDALFAAFLDLMPLQTREDALAALRKLWQQSADENGGAPDLDYWLPLGSGDDGIAAEDLLALESEFGSMPEYWQLRYAASGADPPERIRLLEKATQVAPDDAISLFLYWRETAEHWGPYWGLEMRFVTEGEGSLTPGELSICRNWPQLAAEGMEKAARMDGRNAMLYYWTARYFAPLGEYEHVLELLELGNGCAYNYEPCLFPVSFLLDRIEELPDIVGRKRAGCLATLKAQWLNYPLPNYIRLMDMLKETCVALSLGTGIDDLNTVHRFACRFGQTENALMFQRVVSNVLVSVLADTAVRLWGPMEPQDVEGFNLLHRKLGAATGQQLAWSSCGGYFATRLAGVWTPASPVGDGRDNEAAAPEEVVDYLVKWPVFDEYELRVFGPSVAKLMADLEAFDYTNPAAYRGY